MAGLWENLFGRRRKAAVNPLAVPGGLISNLDATAVVARRPALVKDRPASLEQRYSVLDHGELADEVFLRLRQRVFAAADAGGSSLTVFRESGRLVPNRPYFYIKPPGRRGWLCERSGAGWLVTPAEKIVGRDLFMRDDEPADAVVLYIAKDRVAMPRVRSQLTGEELVALAVYEQRLLSLLGLPCVTHP